jgi:hypothetical protein
MGAHHSPAPAPALDLSKWKKAPMVLMGVGGIGAVLGAVIDTHTFQYSWLLSFVFFLSLCMGGLFLVLVHHIFDAAWSVPIRRINEALACLAPVMAALFIPIAILAPKMYAWMSHSPEADHALHAKQPLFTTTGFYLVSVVSLAVWWFLSARFRYWSLQQDQTGAAEPTRKMRVLAGWGVFAFAFSLTLAIIMWDKALQHEWFSTMYGVYYFAGSVWTTLATVYVIMTVLKRHGELREVIREKQVYFLGSLFFAFTVFYAYVTFSQYFIIWNANVPEETFWYLQRDKGTWHDIGLLIIFGHFFLPFLAMLRIDVKHTLPVMIPLAAWAWLMHFVDMSFNILPVSRSGGFYLSWIDVACFLFMLGLISKMFIKSYMAYPPYPLKDPRMAEALDIYLPTVAEKKTARGGAK